MKTAEKVALAVQVFGRATALMRTTGRICEMVTADGRGLMSVADLALLLFVSRRYVRKKLLRKHVLRPVIVVRGHKYVLRSKAEAYRRKRQRIARRALRELARISQDVGLYDNTTMSR